MNTNRPAGAPRGGGVRGRGWPGVAAAAAVAAVIAVAMPAPAAHADQVRLGQFWVPGVRVDRIDHGQVLYTTRSGAEVSKPLSQLGGLRLDRFPGLGEAFDAEQANHLDQARAKLQQVIAKADHEAWVRRYARRRLVGVLAAQGKAAAAASAYLDLAHQPGVTAAMLGDPPTQVVEKASKTDRQKIATRADKVAGSVPAQLRPLVRKLRDAAGASASGAGSQTTPGAAPGAGAGGKAKDGEQGGKSASAVVLPGEVTLTPIVKPLKAGDFAKALKVANKGLTAPDRLPEKLYLQGMALEGLADQSKDRGRYMDAGLAFMRVVIYFPQSAYTGPAMLEAGYIHQQIGKPQLARRLYSRAGNLIDPQSDPAYFARWQKLNRRASRQANQRANQNTANQPPAQPNQPPPSP